MSGAVARALSWSIGLAATLTGGMGGKRASASKAVFVVIATTVGIRGAANR